MSLSSGQSLFGNIQGKNGNNGNQQNSTLFGNSSTTINQGGLFSNQGSTSNQGGLFSNQGNTANQGGLFGNTSNQGGLFSNTGNTGNQGGLFGNSSNQGGLFSNTGNTANQGGGLNKNLFSNFSFGNNNQSNNSQIPNSTFFTTPVPVIALNQNNDLKNIQLSKLPIEFQNDVQILKLNLKNQEIKLDELQKYYQRLTLLIDQNNRSVEKLRDFNNFVDQKLGKYNEITNQVKDNFNLISESFEEEQKNIKLMEQDSGYKIEIPSKFLLNYSRNLLNRTQLFQQKLNDIITLIKVYNSKNNNDLIFDSDIMESTIAEFIKIIRYLLESNERQEKMINEMLHFFLKFSQEKGYDPKTIYNNIMQQTIENNSNSR